MILIAGRNGVWRSTMMALTMMASFAACASGNGRQEGGAMAVSADAALNVATFASPPPQYRRTITVEEGAGYLAPLDVAAQRALLELDAGGVMISPQGEPSRRKPLDLAKLAVTPLGLQDEYPEGTSPWLPKALPGEARFGSYLADGNAGPGKAPGLGFFTPAWFDAMRGILDLAQGHGRFATYYDEAGFPSGSADHTIPKRFHRKVLRREALTASVDGQFALVVPADGSTTALVALDADNGKRIDLLAQVRAGATQWRAPAGDWRVHRYSIVTAPASDKAPDYNGTADYLDPEASRWFIKHSYDRAYAGLAEHFGRTIRYTFFDDVGVYADEKTWNPALAERFEQITGRPAALYYPALWDDIGADTSAARVGFFKARAELLGDTFPKLITDWAHAHGVQATGHAPGNYDLQPTETIGDPFKFYAHTDVPLADALWGVGFARGGFKLISSVSTQRGLPLTGVEAFSVTHDANGYRRMIELYVRGFNHFITGAREPSKPRGTGAELSQWSGRSSYLLQGGKHVADIAVVFPIESLQAFYSFDAPDNVQALPTGVYAYRDADYQAVGEMLLSELHRDFSFVHPDALAGDMLQVSGDRLVLRNGSDEGYRLLLLPGGDVLSVAAMRKIKAFHEAGGTIIATSLLPTKSAEFGKDEELRRLVIDVFGNELVTNGAPSIHRHHSGGQAVFVQQPSAEILGRVFDQLNSVPDVALAGNPAPRSGNGVFGHTHRRKGGKDIYYFGNSSDTPVETVVTLRGRLDALELWNPHDGTVIPVAGVLHREGAGGMVTEFGLRVDPVSSVAVVGVLE